MSRMTSPRFFNKDGTLTQYSFNCGYVEYYGDWLHNNGVRLYADGCYHVRGIKNDERIWEVFEYVKDARKFARQFGKLVKPATND